MDQYNVTDTSSARNSVYNATSDAEIRGGLVYMGVSPPGGWGAFYMRNLDSQSRALEFTRLEIYSLSNVTTITSCVSARLNPSTGH